VRARVTVRMRVRVVRRYRAHAQMAARCVWLKPRSTAPWKQRDHAAIGQLPFSATALLRGLKGRLEHRM
jgi:hypothetical protein